MHRTFSSRALAAVLLASLTMATACGDDTSAISGTTTTAVTATGRTTEFCAAANEMLTALSTGVDPTEALNAAVVDAPGSVGDDVAAMGEAFATAAASVDDTAFLADDLRRIAALAQSEIASTCGHQIVEIDGSEYAFEGLPTTLDPGPTALHLTNTGEEVHELLLFRRTDGATGDLIDIVNDDPSVSDGRLDEVGVMLPAAPGEDSVLLTDLAAGDYVVVCFLPVGTTTIDQVRALDNFGSLDDHRSQGMISAFSVG